MYSFWNEIKKKKSLRWLCSVLNGKKNEKYLVKYICSKKRLFYHFDCLIFVIIIVYILTVLIWDCIC